MAIKAVLFDAGNTLLTPAIPESQVLSEAAACFGISIDAAVIEKHIPAMYEYYEILFAQDNSVWSTEKRAADIWMSMYHHICGLLGITEFVPEIARKGYEVYLKPTSWALFDDVMPTLLALKSKEKQLGIISNWDKSLEGIIDGMGLRHHFGTVLSSAAVEMYKPHPAIFELALRKLGVKNNESMYVGDHIHADVKGALQAGMTAVLIDREDRHSDCDEFIRIKNLQEILEYLSA